MLYDKALLHFTDITAIDHDSSVAMKEFCEYLKSNYCIEYSQPFKMRSCFKTMRFPADIVFGVFKAVESVYLNFKMCMFASV
jgi:hypothetical protein